jgi:meiotically up-regulated gene 157 (Mug157) protein
LKADGGLPDFLTPANAMLSAELYNIGCMLEDIGTLSNISSKAKKYSASIRQAVYDHGIASNGIFAYEVNGFGSQYIMDDANVPVSRPNHFSTV